jgi:stalled ribosome rescue protein Dom34
MKTTVGLWIDHRKAIIVAVTNKGEETKLIISKVEKQPGRFAGIRSTTPYESQQVRADDSRERKFTGHLNLYYDAVIACIRDAEAILIFGPGEAKGELQKRIKKKTSVDALWALKQLTR